MSKKIIVIITILMVFTIFPASNAQLSLGAEADQKSIEVEISSSGEVNVKHVVKPSNFPVSVDLFDGTVSDISITNESGDERDLAVVGDNDAVLIFPSNQNSIVEYNLDNVLSQKDNLWTWDFSYLETTSFIMPEEVDLVFLNGTPIFLGEKNGIGCHGCKIVLEYSINVLKNINQVNWEDKEFLVETRTSSEIKSFNFNQPTKKISFKVNDNYQFVTIIIPLELLWEPYSVFLDDDKILKHEIINNGTHVWLSMKPETSGEITIIGTTVIPEFPIIAPLAVGFLMILVVPLMKKFNLH